MSHVDQVAGWWGDTLEGKISAGPKKILFSVVLTNLGRIFKKEAYFASMQDKNTQLWFLDPHHSRCFSTFNRCRADRGAGGQKLSVSGNSIYLNLNQDVFSLRGS